MIFERRSGAPEQQVEAVALVDHGVQRAAHRATATAGTVAITRDAGTPARYLNYSKVKRAVSYYSRGFTLSCRTH
jgi:bisphosphoglycerate-independent phosphoglycerate mutase (AlkP superfamily)